ncbi:ATPase family [compost metagenome]
MSLGELGSQVDKLEQTLTKILALAERWNAVLLIDEADVFLEKRTSENLERNAVVAVFLRLLEYYGGILFMTTNRGDNLDEAFLSRVTLGLHFKKPNAVGQTAIWSGLLNIAGIELRMEEIALLVDYGINGREIKNAINTAKALASADGVQVACSHIEEVLDARVLFFKEVGEATRG